MTGGDVDEEARRRFEEAWSTGEAPPLERFLPARDAAAYAPTLEELVHIDLELGWRHGSARHVEAYAERYPELAGRDVLARLLETEVLARCSFAARPARDELAARFPWLEDPHALIEGAAARVVLGPGVALGRYRIDGEHARGTFGRIWIAEDRDLGRTVAVKQLDERHAEDPSLRQRFLTEAKVTARLDHPGIVPVHELREADGRHPHYAMKLVRGETLRARIERVHRAGDHERGPLLDAVLSVARTIAFAHAHGVIHRDLKPDNVVLGDFGEVYVLDWGLAKLRDTPEPAAGDGATASLAARDRTRAGTILGTPAYMPPEQACGDAVDERADVFAIGAMLYHVLAGVPPYVEHTSSDAVLEAVLAGEATPLSELAPGLPPELASIVRKAMARDPADRYASASELAAQLEAYRSGRLVGTHHYRARELAARWARRHRGALVTAGAMLIGIVVLAVLGIREIVRERDRARAYLGEATTLLVETARRELVAARPWAALPLLARAYESGARDRVTRLLLADALRSREALRLDLAGFDQVAFSPDDTRLAATSRDGRFELWDLGASPPVRVAAAALPGARLEDPAFDGPRIVTSGDRARIWDAATGTLSRTLAMAGTASPFAPDRVLVAGDGARLWDAVTGAQLVEVARGETLSRAIASGTRIVTIGTRIAIWDAGTGALLGEACAGGKPDDAVLGDGLLACIGDDMRIHTIDVATARPFSHGISALWVDAMWIVDRKTIATRMARGALALHHSDLDGVRWVEDGGIEVDPRRPFGAAVAGVSGRVFAAVAWQDGTGAVYDVRGGTRLARLDTQLLRSDRISFSASGAQLLTIQEDGSAAARDPATGQVLQVFPRGRARIDRLTASPRETFVVSFDEDRRVRVWTTVRRKLAMTLAMATDGAPLITFDPARPHIATAAGMVLTVRNVEDGRELGARATAAISALRYAPDGATLAVARVDGVVEIRNAVTLDVLQSLAANGDASPRRLAYSPDARWLATATETIVVWDTRTWERLASLAAPGTSAVSFSSDGRALGAGEPDGRMRLWRTADWTRVQTLGADDNLVYTSIDEAIRVEGVTRREVTSYSIDRARTILAGSTGDRRVRLWNARTGKQIAELPDHDVGVTSLTLSRDGQLLVTADAGGALRLWDVTAQPRQLGIVGGHHSLGWLALSEHAGWLATSSSDGTIRVWDLRPEGRPIDELRTLLAE